MGVEVSFAGCGSKLADVDAKVTSSAILFFKGQLSFFTEETTNAEAFLLQAVRICPNGIL